MKEVPFFSKVFLMKSMDIFFTSLISSGAERKKKKKQKNINAAQFQKKTGPEFKVISSLKSFVFFFIPPLLILCLYKEFST